MARLFAVASSTRATLFRKCFIFDSSGAGPYGGLR
jgi:hypothetical protein